MQCKLRLRAQSIRVLILYAKFRIRSDDVTQDVTDTPDRYSSYGDVIHRYM